CSQRCKTFVQVARLHRLPPLPRTAADAAIATFRPEKNPCPIPNGFWHTSCLEGGHCRDQRGPPRTLFAGLASGGRVGAVRTFSGIRRIELGPAMMMYSSYSRQQTVRAPL